MTPGAKVMGHAQYLLWVGVRHVGALTIGPHMIENRGPVREVAIQSPDRHACGVGHLRGGELVAPFLFQDASSCVLEVLQRGARSTLLWEVAKFRVLVFG